jgi:DNA-binding NarL/FixJ family response regulator
MMSAAVDAHPSSPEVSERARDEPVRVVIADVDGLARSMMQTAMRNARGIAIIATTGSAREMLELVRYYRPTVLIVETALLRDRSVKLISSVRAASPATCVLTISVDDDQTALEALRAGAVGHLSKDIDPIKLASLVARAAEGEAIVPRRLVRPLLERLPEPPDARWRPLHSRLTTREWEVVALLDEGASTQDIAERLVLSAATVKSHVKSVLRKLDVHSRRDAVVAAYRLRRMEVMGDKAPPFDPGSSPAAPAGDGNAWEQRDTSAAAQSRLRIAAKRAGDWR